MVIKENVETSNPSFVQNIELVLQVFNNLTRSFLCLSSSELKISMVLKSCYGLFLQFADLTTVTGFDVFVILPLHFPSLHSSLHLDFPRSLRHC